VSHKGTHYKGLHHGIISEKFFDKVQSIFQRIPGETPRKPSNALLQDIIRCGICDCAMTPTYCSKSSRKYRYYACSNHLRKKSCTSENKNIPAGDVEDFVIKAVRKILTDPAITASTIHKLEAAGMPSAIAQESLKNIDNLWETLHFSEQQKIVKLLIKNVIVGNNGFRIVLNPEGAQKLISEITS
jgi:hypothetical protein